MLYAAEKNNIRQFYPWNIDSGCHYRHSILSKSAYGVLLPFFVAWLIAYLIYPMVIFFQHKLRLKNRVISIFVVLLVLLSIITLAFIGLVPPIIEEFGKLKELLTEYFIEGSKQALFRHCGQFHKRHIDMLKIHEALNENNFANT